jgi:hypothetical protein
MAQIAGPLVAPTPAAPVVATEVRPGAFATAVVGGVAAALAGGLVWAGVVIVTRVDVGILAWLVGLATGWAIFQLGGRPGDVATRFSAGVFAAGGILVGKYVVFVHDVRDQVGALVRAAGLSDSYFSSYQMSFFLHHFGSIVRPIYALWVGLAFLAAFRAAGGQSLRGRMIKRV